LIVDRDAFVVMCVYRLHWFGLKVVQGVSEFALKWVFLAPLALVWAVLGASGYLVIDAINEVPQYLQLLKILGNFIYSCTCSIS
jgi:hypothetical protein